MEAQYLHFCNYGAFPSSKLGQHVQVSLGQIFFKRLYLYLQFPNLSLMRFVLSIEIPKLYVKGKESFSQEPGLANGLMVHAHHSIKLLHRIQVFLLQFINFNSCFLELPPEPLKGGVAFMLRSSDINNFNRILIIFIFSFLLG
jgi:hypothetical protein